MRCCSNYLDLGSFSSTLHVLAALAISSTLLMPCSHYSDAGLRLLRCIGTQAST